MKKISNVLLSVSILLITLMLFVVEYNKNDNVFKDTTNTFKTNNALAIMLDDGNGNYTPSTSNAFPTSGYIFNTELSKCENGGEVTWDDTNKKVIVSSNVSDKCYIYFDKEPTFADHIIKLYTTQGSNNLYHHDGTLENGINDGSYRYAGGDYRVSDEHIETYDSINKIVIHEYDSSIKSHVYSLSYETPKIQYSSIKSALEKAVNDGYVIGDLVKNYVCFGTDDEKCDDEHLYRIIGVFDSVIVNVTGDATTETEKRVKLIKAYEGTQASLGTAPHGDGLKHYVYYKGKLEPTPGYMWSGDSIIQSTDWILSALNQNILNGAYLTTLGTNWTDKISTTEWKIGGNTWANIGTQTAATAYQNEVVNPSTNATANEKVGLMYTSDYGFSASPSNWSTNINSYNNDTNRNNNWLFLAIDEWFITPNSTSNACITDYTGNVRGGTVTSIYGVRPTFYLNSNVMFAGGSGTETDPYRIA